MWYETMLKLICAMMLGGVIGYERENMNRPAGLRTHVLVCVGAAIVQVTSIEFYRQMMGTFTSDPFRLGAQVISGIGFLGAGTIMKEGNSIKGLTTAASLWTVACLGLTIGTGLYKESIFAAVAILVALKALRFFERKMLHNKNIAVLELEIYNNSDRIGSVLEVITKYEMDISYLLLRDLKENKAKMEITLGYSQETPLEYVLQEVALITGVQNASFERSQ